MKTYSETQGKKPFDWNKALNDSKKDWIDLFKRASAWVTCACGNQCDIIPRGLNGKPEDALLRHLGMDFYRAIMYQTYEKAKQILKQIEVRSAELINELTK